MNIGIDVDGVLTDFECFIDWCGTKYLRMKNLPCKIINHHSYSFREKFECSEDTEYSFYKKHLIWYSVNMPIRENAAETIDRLHKKGHKIYIITGRALSNENNFIGSFIRKLMKNWLKKNNVHYDKIYFIDYKKSASQKVKLCQDLKIDYFIEDEPLNIQQIEKVCKVICLSSQYNDFMQNVLKVNDFTEIYNIINGSEPLKLYSKEQINEMDEVELRKYFNNLKILCKKMPFDYGKISEYRKNHKVALRIIKPIFNLIFHIKIINNYNSLDNNTIYVSNHRRSIDIPLAYYALTKNYARFLAKREYQFSALNWIQKKIGTIYVGREYPSSCRSSFITMLQTVVNGESIFIFPEGTRNKSSNILLPFKKGAVKIAQITGRPIVPLVMYKRDTFHYEIIIGNKINVSIYDNVEQKNNELWEYMKKTYLNFEK